MLQLGIRLHDVNAALGAEEQTMEARAAKAREEGFSCVQLALSKVVRGVAFDESALTEGLAFHTKRVFAKNDLDVAVLGCYLNLAHPDPEKLREIQSRYFGHLRVAALMGAGVVGTETGAPNGEYQLDENTHTDAALETFIRNLAPVVECAERWGTAVAIEPVWSHIVCDTDRALRVLRAIASPNLRIILDPVNLLSPDNLHRRDAVIGEAMEKLCEHIAVVHLKDYVRQGNDLPAVAAGLGEMDYTGILRFMKARKPYIQATLENTTNDNAQAALAFIQRSYEAL